MSKSNLPKPVPALLPEKELPEVDWIALVPRGKLYVVLTCRTQGRTVLEEDVLTDGAVSREQAVNVLKVETAKRFILPRGSQL